MEISEVATGHGNSRSGNWPWKSQKWQLPMEISEVATGHGILRSGLSFLSTGRFSFWKLVVSYNWRMNVYNAVWVFEKFAGPISQVEYQRVGVFLAGRNRCAGSPDFLIRHNWYQSSSGSNRTVRFGTHQSPACAVTTCITHNFLFILNFGTKFFLRG